MHELLPLLLGRAMSKNDELPAMKEHGQVNGLISDKCIKKNKQ